MNYESIYISKFSVGHKGLLQKPAAILSRITNTGIIVLDTNAWLDLYRFHTDSRAEVIAVLEAVKDRLWMPDHVRKEFLRRRLDVIHDAQSGGQEAGAFESQKEQLLAAVRNWANRKGLKTDAKESLVAKFQPGIDAFNAASANASADVVSEWILDPSQDKVLASIANLIGDKVGDPFDVGRAESEMAKFKDRSERKVPPGYKDAGKTNGNAHGDYFVWRQILDFASLSPKDILFVTNDGKDDWMYSHKGKTLGPKEELISEFAEATSNAAEVHVTTVAGFLELARTNLSLRVDDTTVASANFFVKERDKSQRSKIEFRGESVSGGARGRRFDEMREFLDDLHQNNEQVFEFLRMASQISGHLRDGRLFSSFGFNGPFEAFKAINEAVLDYNARTEMNIEVDHICRIQIDEISRHAQDISESEISLRLSINLRSAFRDKDYMRRL